MNETGFNWKAVSDMSLGTSQYVGGKKEKTQITAVLYCNATGTDRAPIWYIGKAARPVAFRTAQIQSLEKLGTIWRHNLTVWMDYKIIVE